MWSLFNKSNLFQLILLIQIIVVSSSIQNAQSLAPQSLTSLAITQITGEKPQSKVWTYDTKWWMVMPNSSGTHVWRLDGTTWTSVVDLSSNTDTFADCKVVGNVTYVLLFRPSVPEATLYKLTYSSGYGSTTLSTVSLDSGVETATIDIDSQGIIWLASDEKSGANANIYVRWSASDYSSWSTPISLATGLKTDDICAITAFDDKDAGKKVGVMWSDQNNKEFGFKWHLDVADPTGSSWSAKQIAASGSGGVAGLADDHINFAVTSNGTIFAAVKTGYDASGFTQIGLLKRNPSGIWSGLYEVEQYNVGTRPIALFNETNGKIIVLYTKTNNPDNIVYRSSDTSSISFGSQQTLISGSYNNVTSTKQNITNEVVIMASNSSGTNLVGVLASDSPFPVELISFTGILHGSRIDLHWRTETEVNNFGFNVERSSSPLGTIWETIGFVEGHGNSNSPKEYSFTDIEITASGRYLYRLKQIDNDGTFEYSDIVTVEVAMPDNYYLSQNYPNPFNPLTKIEFTIPEKQMVSLKIFNSIGELVDELVDEVKEAGKYSINFDASNLTSGVYLYRLQTESFSANKKMILLR